MDPADLLVRVIGTNGRWQILITLLIFVSKFSIAWHQLATVIQAPPITFTCSDTNYTKCDPDCPSYDYDRSVWKQTIQMKWDLVCQFEQLKNVAQTFNMLGVLVGNVLFGYLADRFGRRKPLVASIIIHVTTGCAAAFAPWFSLFVVLKCVTNVAVGGTMLITFVILMEFTAKSWRTSIGVLYHLPFHLGYSLLALIGYYLRSYDWIQLTISSPQALLISYWCLLPESPRWLLTMKKIEPLIKLLEKVAKCNKRPTETVRAEVEAFAEEVQSVPVRKGGNIADLCRTKRMRTKTIILLLNWFTIGFAFFGVAQFMGEVGDLFINISCAGFVQIPGNVIAILSLIYLGRKWSLIGSFVMCFVPCFVIACLPNDPHWPVTALGCISQMGISMSFSIVYVYTIELYPTQVRTIGMGVCSMTGRVGSMACPYIMSAGLYAQWLPPVILGITPVLASLGTLIFLPETLKQPLMDTVEEADQV